MKIKNCFSLNKFFLLVKSTILLIVITYLTSFFLYAQETVWERTNGPYSGIPNNLYATKEKILFLASNYGLYRSSDNGLSWSKVYSDLDAYGNMDGLGGPVNLDVINLVQLKDGDLLIGCNYKGEWDWGSMVYLASKVGDNWRQAISVGNLYAQNIKGIAQDSVGNIYVVYSAQGGGIYRSSNKGLNWQSVLYIPAYLSFITVTSTGSIIVSKESEAVLYRSTDNGISWTTLNTNINSQITALVSINNQVFLGTASGEIYRSLNNGNNWQNISTGLNSDIILDITYDSNTNNIFSSTNKGIFKFNSININWKLVNIEHKNSKLYYNNYTDTFFSYNEFGIYSSLDDGNTFEHLTIPISLSGIRTLYVSRNGNILASSKEWQPGIGVFITKNIGKDWELKPVYPWNAF